MDELNFKINSVQENANGNLELLSKCTVQIDDDGACHGNTDPQVTISLSKLSAETTRLDGELAVTNAKLDATKSDLADGRASLFLYSTCTVTCTFGSLAIMLWPACGNKSCICVCCNAAIYTKLKSLHFL